MFPIESILDNKIEGNKGYIKRDDFINEESKLKEFESSNFFQGHNRINQNQNQKHHQQNFQLAQHDHEILFLTTQLTPTMDRIGRLLSGKK